MTDPLDFPIPVTLDAVIVNYNDLERLIEQVYGKKVSIPASYEMSNDSFLALYHADTKEENYDMNGHDEDIDKWLESGEEWIDLDAVMADLIFKGIFPPRHYVIEVCW